MRVSGVLYIALGAAIAGFPAAAQEDSRDPLAELRKCSGIAENDARLACYDRQARLLLSAEESGEIEIVDREKAEKARKDLFGFSGVKVPFFDEGEGVEEIESTITRVARVGRDGWLITIADGNAVWRITDPPMRFNAPRVGDKVTIKRGALTSYFIAVRTQLGVKAKRVE